MIFLEANENPFRQRITQTALQSLLLAMQCGFVFMAGAPARCCDSLTKKTFSLKNTHAFYLYYNT